MASISRSFLSLGILGRNLAFSQPLRTITTTPVVRLKEIVETKEGNTLIIEAKYLPDPYESRIIKRADNGACILCSTGVEVKHTDVLILKQFLRSDGCMLPKRVTGLCNVQQKRVEKMVTMAHRAGLLINVTPPNCKRNPKLRRKQKAFNVYYDETTIRHKYWNVTYRQ